MPLTVHGSPGEPAKGKHQDAAFFAYDSGVPLQPTMELEEELPDHQRYAVTYRVEGETVYAAYFKPRLPGRVPAVIGIHGIYSNDKAQFWPIAREMVRRGIAVLMPSLPYHHERRTKDAIISGQGIIVTDSERTVMNFRRAVVETRRGLDWLSSQPDIDPTRIGAVGVSLGALVTSLALKAEPRFASGAMVVGGCDLPDVVATSGTFMAGVIRIWNRMGLADFGRMSNGWERIDPSLYPDPVDRPVLMLNGTNDVIFSTHHVKALADSWRRVTQEWTDSGHYYPEMGACFQTAFWFGRTLGAPGWLAMANAEYSESPVPMKPGDSRMSIDIAFRYRDRTVTGHRAGMALIDKRAPVVIGTPEGLASFKGSLENGPYATYTLPEWTAGNLSLAAGYLMGFPPADTTTAYLVKPDGKGYRVLKIGFTDLLALSAAHPWDSGEPVELRHAKGVSHAHVRDSWQTLTNSAGYTPRHYREQPATSGFPMPTSGGDVRLALSSILRYIGAEMLDFRFGLYYHE